MAAAFLLPIMTQMLTVMENDLILSKESSESEIKRYFNAVLELSKSDNEFPISLDEVWMLVYGQKSDAVSALKSNFIENVDYQVLRRNPQNSNGGRPTNEYKLTVSCMEFFIARKVRPVFEVYRQVFHKVTKKEISRKELALMVLQAEEEKEKLIIENQLLISENSRLLPKASFVDKIIDTGGKIDVGQAAKLLKLPFGRNKLFEELRKTGIFFKNRNEPKQQYIESGYFELREQFIERKDHPGFTVIKVLVTQKGLEFLNRLLNGEKSDGKMMKLA